VAIVESFDEVEDRDTGLPSRPQADSGRAAQVLRVAKSSRSSRRHRRRRPIQSMQQCSPFRSASQGEACVEAAQFSMRPFCGRSTNSAMSKRTVNCSALTMAVAV